MKLEKCILAPSNASIVFGIHHSCKNTSSLDLAIRCDGIDS